MAPYLGPSKTRRIPVGSRPYDIFTTYNDKRPINDNTANLIFTFLAPARPIQSISERERDNLYSGDRNKCSFLD